MRDRFIKRSDGVIQIPPEVAKTGRQRLVNIQPNLGKWLDAFPLDKYPLYPANLESMMTEVREKFGLKPDVLRHTFASMHVGKFRSIGDCAIQSGNSEQVVKDNYLHQVTEAEAALFWEITPEVTAKHIMPVVVEQQIGRGTRLPTGEKQSGYVQLDYWEFLNDPEKLSDLLDQQARRTDERP